MDLFKRKCIARFGTRGNSVRVYREPKLNCYRVHSGTGARRQVKSFPLSTEGKAWAYEWAARIQKEMASNRPGPVRMADLWQAYTSSVAWAGLVDQRRIVYSRSWKRFADEFPRTPPEEVHFGTLDTLRARLTARGVSRGVQRHTVATVKRVFCWAKGCRIISRNHVEGYRFPIARGELCQLPAEYSRQEWERLLEVLRPMDSREWRAFVALSIIGAQGVRSRAALHLAWEDVNEEAGVVTWRGQFDKNRRTWSAPLRQRTREALAVARHWQAVGSGHVPNEPCRWVLPAANSRNKGETYAYSSLWWSLSKAEKRAHVAHVPKRGAHGLRRMLAGDVYDATLSIDSAMGAIGDTSVGVMERYLKVRSHRVLDAVRILDAKRAARKAVDSRTTPFADQDL